jgi:hypothetical protein
MIDKERRSTPGQVVNRRSSCLAANRRPEGTVIFITFLTVGRLISAIHCHSQCRLEPIERILSIPRTKIGGFSSLVFSSMPRSLSPDLTPTTLNPRDILRHAHSQIPPLPRDAPRDPSETARWRIARSGSTPLKSKLEHWAILCNEGCAGELVGNDR